MSKKVIIQYVIIAIGFLGTSFVLYNGFHHSEPPPAQLAGVKVGVPGLTVGGATTTAPAVAAPAGGSNAAILPYGNKLDFTVLDKEKLEYGLVKYPVLSTTTEVGIVGESSMMQGTGQ